MNFKILFRLSWLMAFVFVLYSSAFCVQAQISAGTDTNNITIGDIVNYTVLINLPDEARIKDPFITEGSLGEFEIKDFKWSVEKNGGQKFRLDYYLRIFKTGQQSIPAYRIQYRVSDKEQWQELSAEQAPVNVVSVLGENKEAELKPLKPKVIIWRDYLLWIILLLLLGAVLWAGLKYRQKKNKVLKDQVVAEPAHIIAYRELEALKRSDLISRGLIEVYYEKLSGCVRRYLENRFFLRAPWMSTEEFLQAVKTSPVLNSGQTAALKDFLLLSDMVKFARYGSSSEEALEAFGKAENFIDQTKQEESLEEKIKK